MIQPQYRNKKYVSEKEEYADKLERQYYALVDADSGDGQSLFEYLKAHGFKTNWLNRHGYYAKEHK